MKVSENISADQVRIIQDCEILEPDAQTTTDSYADLVGSKIDAANYRSVAMVLKNTHGSNGIKWQVVASIDDSTYVVVQSEATIAAAASGSYSTTQAVYRYYKIQIKAASGGSQGTGLAHVIAK